MTPTAKTAQDTVNVNIDGRLVPVAFTGSNIERHQENPARSLELAKHLARMCSDIYKKQGIDGINRLAALPETVLAEYRTALEKHIKTHGDTFHSPPRDANEALFKEGYHGILLNNRLGQFTGLIENKKQYDNHYHADRAHALQGDDVIARIEFPDNLEELANFSVDNITSSSMFFQDLKDITRTIQEQHQAIERAKTLPELP